MSTAKPTPGDWEVVGNHIRSSMVQEDSDRPRGVMLANVFDGFGIGHSEEAKANTRLMAAAKKLLEALQALVGTQGDPNNGWRGTGGTDVLFACEYCGAKHEDCSAIDHAANCPVPKARAVIAKATGSAA